MNSNKHYIVFDISNMLYRTFFSNKQTDDGTTAGLAHHAALTTLNKYFKQFNPHKVIMAFDRTSWRKSYTASDDSLTTKAYKGNRRLNMTPSEKERFNRFMDHIKDFEDIMREHTSVICLAGEGLEADDLVAGFCEKYGETDNVTVVSADKDLIQLLRYSNVRLIDPASGKPRSLTEWDDDVDYFLFEKCMRGDPTDNVQSALPRVRSARIKKAYTDPFEMQNLMHETWTDHLNNKYVVRDLFKENERLMDLRKQPDDIRQRIFEVIDTEMKDSGKFSFFHFMKFLGKYELKKVSQQIELFIPLLSR